MISRLFFFVLLFSCLDLSNEPAKGHPVTIPTQVVENMFYAHPVTKDGIELNFYTDSGGGIIIFRSVVDRLHLPIVKRKIEGEEAEEVTMPEFQPGKTIPPPLGHDSKLLVIQENKGITSFGENISGTLGQQWFAGRVWTWDYPGCKLLWRAEGDLPNVATSHRIQLGFGTNFYGKRLLNLSFARIQATIDGEVIDLLFDTGATTIVTESAMKAIHDGHAAHRATSFIIQSIFDRWHTKHPDWKMVEKAENTTGSWSAMIEVPKLSVGGYEVGPVWFTVRPDKNFDQGVSQWMDKNVHGALGGSAFKFFRITVDYPNATAYFEKP
jgi:hypothetical protein